MARLKVKYTEEIAPALMKKFQYKSVMQIPQIAKVIVNVGCGESKNNAKEIEAICKDIATITGQKPITTKARKSVANFKVREGETVGPLSFILANVLPRWITYCVCCGTEGSPPTPSTHRLRRGLPGYLILFAPHAFEPQRQLQTREPLSPPVFLHISTHFTATHGIPLSPSALKFDSFQSELWLSHSL